MRNRQRLLLSTILVVAGLLPGVAGIGSAQTRSLRILLTNDDGFDSAGLKTMHAALRAAGHRVTVVAPASNQSSTSMSMTSGVIKVESKGDGVWAVSGTPADSAVIGIAHILRDTPQDLVVSGTNAGANLGTSTNNSGTVSAAIAATRYGVPAIATSAGTGAASAAAYDVAAAIVNQMISTLDASRPPDGKLMPDRIVINMNVPAIADGKLMGIRWAPLSARSSVRAGLFGHRHAQRGALRADGGAAAGRGTGFRRRALQAGICHADTARRRHEHLDNGRGASYLTAVETGAATAGPVGSGALPCLSHGQIRL